MRKPRALATLFPTMRGDLLAATLNQPAKWWFMSELAQFLKTTPSSLQRELKALVDGGILQQRREGTRTYFKAETRSPLFPELRRLVEKTVGVLPTLQEVLAPLQAAIDCAFVYGSLARSDEHALSDVDLMVIGSVGLAELTPALRKAETRLGREVNATSYSTREFRNKVAAKDHFLSEVLSGPRQFVKGDQRDLDEIVGKPRRSATSNLKKRARRHAGAGRT
jgi:predicted nucleotidyltransferase